jgi:arylsulfatase A-like enzyme
MTPIRNVLFIMCDQLRRDYLGCYGHPSIRTPHIDALAARGTRFNRAYVQGPVCGPSRMSTYTGRYVASHGATWNFVPLPVQIPTLGDYMRGAGLRTALVGKSHVLPDIAGLWRLGLDPASGMGALLAEGGFEPFARHDGIVPDAKAELGKPPYNGYLQQQGYDARNAWHEFANAGADKHGQLQTGWKMRNAGLAARVNEEHSETAWVTDEALRFIKEQGESPWCLHLSYVKPHWPYIAPAPYHEAYGPADVVPAARSEAERTQGHPVLRAFQQHVDSQSFARDEVRNTVIPTYMGLVQQIDDHIGRLMKELKALGREDDTLVVFTSDHGDLLGDHWLGEKEMFYESSAAVPLIIVDPRTGSKGKTCNALVESIDLIPTFLDALGAPPEGRWLEGQSLLPTVCGTCTVAREAAFSELDYAYYPAARSLGLDVNQARATMASTDRWKYIDFAGFSPQLFDLQEDPQELLDLGTSASHVATRAEMQARLARWRGGLRSRATMSDHEARLLAERRNTMKDFVIGAW